MIYETLKNRVLEQAAGLVVKDLRVGLKYILVELSNGACGVAYMPVEFMSGCSCRLPENQNINYIGEEVVSIIEKPYGVNLLKNSIAIAIINALVNNSVEGYSQNDVIEEIQAFPEDRVCMVGHFMPVEKRLGPRVKNIEIIEKKPGEHYKSEQDYSAIVKECEVIIITATSLIYNNLEQILNECSHCREKVLLGPSTPMVPEIFKDYGITLLSGMIVEDVERMKQVISLGQGTRAFKESVKKVNVRI